MPVTSGGPQRSENPALSPSESANAARMVASSISTGTPAATATWVEPNVRPPALRGPEQRPDEAILGPRCKLQQQLHLARNSLHPAQHLVGYVLPEIVAALALGNRHRVRQAHDAGVGRERRFQHQRAGQVAAGVVKGSAGRIDQ